jgi:leader peptidase (prepilin peptidase)/N-methyltransferase
MVTPMSMRALAHRHSLNIATAMLFGLAVWRIGLSPELPAVLAFIFGGTLLAVIDWKVQRLPTRIVYFTLAGVAGGLVFASLVEWDWKPLGTALLGAALFSNAFYLIWFFTTRITGMTVLGFGDVRLAAVLGLLLGWYGLPYVLYGAVVGHVFALAIVVATCIHRRQLFVRYSFGPPLIAGTLAVVLLQA